MHHPNTEEEAKTAGLTPLTADELHTLFSDHTCTGLYLGGFRFLLYVAPDLSMEGKNHVGTHAFGTLSVDPEAHTLTVTWKNAWDHTTTRGYRDGENVHFFDVPGGGWRNTFFLFIPGKQSLEIQ